MIQGLSSPGAGPLPQSGPHDEFLELCAASTTGDLSDDEQGKLQQHLAVCAACRDALRQYESIVAGVIPGVAAAQVRENTVVDDSWSRQKQEAAEKALFQRLARGEKKTLGHNARRSGSSFFPNRILPFASDSTWRNVWMLYAAGILLLCALSFFAYRVETHRAIEVSRFSQPQSVSQGTAPEQASLEEQLSDAGHDRALANAEIAQRDKVIADLRRRLATQSTEISELKRGQVELARELQTGNTSQQDLTRQKAELAKKVESAEKASQDFQQKLEFLAQQSAQDAALAKASQAKVDELARKLQQQQDDLNQRNEMLAKDRDIRDVMGARDLYIAEIYDVAGTGETKKPYGRVFYTRGKSLIFYAYDLDEQPGLKLASAFQAWGRRGPDRQQAINLGVFYEDNGAKKRWILKCDDPKTLAQIDAVFVTVEPKGGSHKPSNKTLLFASLKIDPNHP